MTADIEDRKAYDQKCLADLLRAEAEFRAAASNLIGAEIASRLARANLLVAEGKADPAIYARIEARRQILRTKLDDPGWLVRLVVDAGWRTRLIRRLST